MKNLVFFILLLSISILSSNVIETGPYAIEVMWVDGEWYLELLEHYLYPPTLQDCYLICDMGYSYFLGNSFPSYGPLVVSIDDINVPLQIDNSGDHVEMGWDGANGPSCEFIFGNSSYSMAPLPGESLVRKFFADPFYPLGFYLYCRDNSPTLYFGNDAEGYTGTFSGNIVNSLGEPLAGAVLEYFPTDGEYQIITDLDGNYTKEMNTVRYDILVKYEAITYIDTTISVAPDSVTSIDFVIPTVQSAPSLEILKNSKIHNYPNPFNPITNIQFSLPFPMNSVEIDIFNNKAQLIKIINCTDPTCTTPQTVTWKGKDNFGKSVSSGVYFARLVGDGFLLKECKMLLLK